MVKSVGCGPAGTRFDSGHELINRLLISNVIRAPRFREHVDPAVPEVVIDPPPNICRMVFLNFLDESFQASLEPRSDVVLKDFPDHDETAPD
ncbi:hypothetical protein EVAR_31934_1 [Eumeta japonica]|uniref:Uncharacterized protein n=1 Tax=Eumeta variegata TaxID=151549 RepID=A0A4C1WPR5_EUMVA|nr:hypothetical protein EVAR_31934_1 [Eumeta japonica]